MNVLSLISSLAAPHDLWTILMDWIQGGVGNLGWALLILTVLVKLITLPLEFVQKLSQKKQTLIQQKCAPQIAKLQKKFGNDRQRLQVQTQAIYKAEGLKMGTGCLVMLVNMILTMVIFFSFYGTLRDVSAYNAINQYEQVVEASNAELYNQIITYSDSDEIVDKATADAWFEKYQTAKNYIDNSENDKTTETYLTHKAFVDQHDTMVYEATEASTAKARQTWNAVKENWLWVQNIWVADATTNPFPTYESLKDIAKDAGSTYVEYVEANIAEEDYNKIASILHAQKVKYNGYYILAILAGLVTFLSQYITGLHSKLKSKKANQLAKTANAQTESTLKVMKIIMPIIMVMFVLTSSASFGIYILASNISSILFGEITSLIVDKMTKKKQQEVEEALEKEANRLIKKGKLQG